MSTSLSQSEEDEMNTPITTMNMKSEWSVATTAASPSSTTGTNVVPSENSKKTQRTLYDFEFNPDWHYFPDRPADIDDVSYDVLGEAPFHLSDITKTLCGGSKCLVVMSESWKKKHQDASTSIKTSSQSHFTEVGYLVAKNHHDELNANSTLHMERWYRSYMLAEAITTKFGDSTSTMLDGPPQIVDLDLAKGVGFGGDHIGDTTTSTTASIAGSMFYESLERFLSLNKSQSVPLRIQGVGWVEDPDQARNLGDGGVDGAAGNPEGKKFELLKPLLVQKVNVAPSPNLKVQYLFDDENVLDIRYHLSFLEKIWPRNSKRPDMDTVYSFVTNLRSGMKALRNVFDRYLCLYHDTQFMVDYTGRVHQIDLDRCWTATPGEKFKEGLEGKRYRRDKFINTFQQCLTIAIMGRFHPDLQFYTYHNIDEDNTNRTILVKKSVNTGSETDNNLLRSESWSIESLPGLRAEKDSDGLGTYYLLDGLNTSRAYDCFI
jgi:hypothetical protein